MPQVLYSGGPRTAVAFEDDADTNEMRFSPNKQVSPVLGINTKVNEDSMDFSPGVSFESSEQKVVVKGNNHLRTHQRV